MYYSNIAYDDQAHLRKISGFFIAFEVSASKITTKLIKNSWLGYLAKSAIFPTVADVKMLTISFTSHAV